MRGAMLPRLLLAQAALLAGVGATTCLPNAIDPRDRMNINVKGVAMPLGIWEYGWESAAMVAQLIRILSEEKLGTNVSTFKGPSSSIYGSLAVATCANPLDDTAPECDRDESYLPPHHIVSEWWPVLMKYGRLWFVENMPKLAPVFLGHMGYPGRDGIHIHSDTVVDTLASEGQHLQYFGFYNKSWYDQKRHFDNTTSIALSKLKTCTDMGGLCGSVYTRVSATYNDTAGFEVRGGETCALCPTATGGKWWYSPGCRDDPITCIPLVTGGSGWLFGNFMEKILKHNMPFALATSATWGDFLDNFRDNKVLSYDWTPGVHFGALKHYEFQFPPHNASEFRDSIYQSMDPDSKLERLAWNGLQRAAPDVFFLGENIDVTMTDMNNMLGIFVADGGLVEDAACKWLQQNEDLWKNWLPESDATRCTSGHGMVTPAGQFTENRTEALKCIACTAGMKSRAIGSGLSMTYTCDPCDAGSVQPMWGADHCVACDMGYYQNKTGESVCDRCPRGSYSDIFGLPDCHICEDGFTTEGTGFTSGDSCLCPPDSYLNPADGACKECGKGTNCAGFGRLPEAAEGYHLESITSEGELSVFQCFKDIRRCPGGLVGVCAPGREGNACAECQPEMAPVNDGSCQACQGSDKGPFAAACSIFGLILLGLYCKTSLAHGERQNQSLILIVLTGAQIVSIAQLLGVSYKLSVAWEPPISTLLTILRVFNFDIQVLRMDCVGGFSVLTTYVFTLLVAPMALLTIASMHVFRVLAFHRGQFGDKHHAVLGTGGLLLMGFFITISTTILSPFQCQQHPNEMWTLLQYESQMCWQGGDHTSMMIIAACAITMPIGFIALVTWLLYVFPQKMAEGDVYFLNTYSFLFLRVKPSTRWFMLIYLLRNLLIAVVPSIPSPFWQIILMEILFALTIAAIAYVQPWRLSIVNHLEVLISIMLLLLMCIASFFITNADIQGIASAGFVTVLICFFCFPVCVACVLIRRVFKQKDFHFFLCHHKAAAGTFCRLLKYCLLESRGIKGGVFIDSDNLSDLDQLFNYVASEVGVLAVLATREIFLRPWCLGEVATAHICKTSIFPVYFSDFSLPDKDFIDNIESRVDLSVLTENSVGIQNVRKALTNFSSLAKVNMPVPFEAGYMKVLATQLVKGDTSQVTSASSNKPVGQKLSQVDTLKVVLADISNHEAVSAAAILIHLVRPLTNGRAEHLPIVYEDLTCKAGMDARTPCGVGSLIVMCTGNCFAQAQYLQALCWAMDEGVSKILPIAVADSFQFPTEQFYKSLEENTSRLCQIVGTTIVPDLLTKYVESIFKKIAVPFSTMSSASVLESQAQMVWSRMGIATPVDKKVKSKGSVMNSKEAASRAGKESSQAWVSPPAHQKTCSAIVSVRPDRLESLNAGDTSGDATTLEPATNEWADTWVLEVECEGNQV